MDFKDNSLMDDFSSFVQEKVRNSESMFSLISTQKRISYIFHQGVYVMYKFRCCTSLQ